MSTIKIQLEQLGLTGQVNLEKTEMRTSCPFHEDSSPSFSINLTTGQWICFRGCGSGTLPMFLERLGESVGGADYEEGRPSYQAEQEPILQSWLDRGLTREILLKWGIKWDAEAGAMRIPVYGEGSKLLSNIWRAPEGVKPKYRYESGFRRVEVLFGSWRLPTPWTKVVLVEGPLDAVWVQEAGELGVAILGSSLSKIQVEILVKMQARQVTLCFDEDEAGEAAAERAIPMLREEGMYVYRTRLPRTMHRGGRGLRIFKDIQEVPLKLVGPTIGAAHLCVNGLGVVHPRFKRWDTERQISATSKVWRNR